MKRKIAQISGAALGYIHGNWKGAYAGFKMAGLSYDSLQKRSKHMAPVPRSNGSSRGARSRYYPTPSTVRRAQRARSSGSAPMSLGTSQRTRSTRSGTVSSAMSVRSSAASYARSVAMSNGGALVARTSIRRGRKVAREGVKKMLKVPLKLRKQIKQVTATKGLTGWIKEIFPAECADLVDNLQNVVYGTSRTSDTYESMFFGPGDILRGASILWNKYLPTSQHASSGSAGMFLRPSLVVDVVKQHVTYRLKSNIARTVEVKIWDISPKGAILDSTWDTLSWWTTELARLSPTGAAGTTGDVAAYNVWSCLVGTIGFHPKLLPSFNELFTLDEKIITLEAGKEYYHKVVGPNNKRYDFKKYYNDASAFMNFQKFCKQTFFCFTLDLNNSTTNVPGRTTDTVAGDPYGIIIESTLFTKLTMPEQTGFVVPTPPFTTGQSQYMSQRRNCFALKNWAAAQTGDVVYTEDNNPQAPAIDGV